MNKLKFLIWVLLFPLLMQGQYTRHYKEPIKISKGALIVIGGVAFTTAPIIAEFTSSTTPFKNNSKTKGIKLSPNKMAVFCGISVTIVGLITLLTEK